MKNLAICALLEEERDEKMVNLYLAKLEKEYNRIWNTVIKPYEDIKNYLTILFRNANVYIF